MKESKYSVAIVIPCYNEAKRLDLQQISAFLQTHATASLVLVDDGSTDSTPALLQKICAQHPHNIAIHTLTNNAGKAEAVRQGMLHAYTYNVPRIAYLDADFATSLQECYDVAQQVKGRTCVAFGSRISKIDTVIKKKWHRFVIGRLLSAVISGILQIPVYDTQCGCKVFAKEEVALLFKEPFGSTWLFDVEIFYRCILLHGRPNIKHIAKEIPLKQWIDVRDSKVPLAYFFTLWRDLYMIRRTYKKRERQS